MLKKMRPPQPERRAFPHAHMRRAERSATDGRGGENENLAERTENVRLEWMQCPGTDGETIVNSEIRPAAAGNNIKQKKGYAGIYNRVIKRIIDFPLALAGSVIVTPLILVIGIFIAAEDGFPIFYTPLRGGYHGKPFHIFKLRTMRKNADRYGGTTALNDPRITRCGRLLRKIKLDEISQFYNVLLGTMSFVGPRPELLQYTEAYTGDERLILEVRPGITDFSSIAFISLDEIVGAENADEMYEKYVLHEKNQLRVRYAREVSFGTDVYLFGKTILAVLQKAVRVICGRNGEKNGGIHNTEK